MSQRRAFRHRVQFEQPVETIDAGGGRSVAWSVLSIEPCFIERVRSFGKDMERFTGSGLVARPVVRVHVGNNSNTRLLTGECRGVDLDTYKILNVHSVQDIEGKGKNLVVTAVEGEST